MKDFYYILGVDADCNADDIKDAYRKLSKKFHPDLNHNDSYFENRFKDIQEAYETLSDTRSRRRYDDQFFRNRFYPPNPEPVKQRRYPRTTAIDIIFTLVLITLTIVFGKYVMTAINGPSKTAKVAQVSPVIDTGLVTETPVKSVHHKKKKHVLLAADHTDQNIVHAVKAPVITIHSVTNSTPAIKAVAVTKPNNIKTDTFKPQPVVINHQASPFKQVNNPIDNSIPYSSYLRSNITGVVNMHSADNLNSDILAVIPAHSKVLVLQKGDTYYKVQFNGNEGYVPRWTVLTK